MIYINAFIVAGLICLIGQLIYDSTNLTSGHITSLFVVIGGGLEFFSIYDKLLEFAGSGASLPITSFGHSLTHSVIEGVKQDGLLGIFSNALNLTSSGISFAIIFVSSFKNLSLNYTKYVIY